MCWSGSDGLIQAPPAVALVVVVGIEFKGASRELACWRFLRNALQIIPPRTSKSPNAAIGVFFESI
jgi:hypothetical protein